MYQDSGGTKCPLCGNTEIVTDHIDFMETDNKEFIKLHGKHYGQTDVTCIGCQSYWISFWKLIGIDKLSVNNH
jgi:predicted nucleic-acid-binding Zn-ribbon protein